MWYTTRVEFNDTRLQHTVAGKQHDNHNKGKARRRPEPRDTETKESGNQRGAL